MDTVAVLELDTPTNVRVLQPDLTPARPEDPVRRVHVAPAEPSGACGPLTLCGLDTAEMVLAPHQRFDRSTRWHACSTCHNDEAQADRADEAHRDRGPTGDDDPGSPSPSAP